ncbi:MAG: hypothetical protein QMD36_05695 [Candidatus Aenigmarchaeota archaeon]|nr:hypothetical protein [Candidatus Aenigmarchaeota archaeon]
MGSVPLSELPSALWEYVTKMQTAEAATGFVGWVTSLATIGIVRGLWRRYTRGKE